MLSLSNALYQHAVTLSFNHSSIPDPCKRPRLFGSVSPWRQKYILFTEPFGVDATVSAGSGVDIAAENRQLFLV